MLKPQNPLGTLPGLCLVPAEGLQRPPDPSPVNCSIPFTDLKPFIMKYILKRWQDSWHQQIHNKLHRAKYIP
jgi:hypothetical protein